MAAAYRIIKALLNSITELKSTFIRNVFQKNFNLIIYFFM